MKTDFEKPEVPIAIRGHWRSIITIMQFRALPSIFADDPENFADGLKAIDKIERNEN